MTVETWSQSTANAIRDAWDRIISFLPNLIGAIVIVIIGMIVGAIIKWAVVKILEAARVQRFFDQVRFTEAMKKSGMNVNVAQVSGEFLRWIIIIIFIISAADVLGLSAVSNVLNDILRFVPNVVVAILILFIGIIVANFLAQIVRAAAAGIGAQTSIILSTATRYAIYIFVVLAALAQLQIAPSLINIFFTGVVAAIAIAAGLSFGLGGQTAAADLIKRVREEFRK